MNELLAMSADDAMGMGNRLEKEIMAILFEFRPVMTNRMKLEAAQRIAKILTPHKEKDTSAKIY
jgi:hypothetical protein